MKCKAEEHIHKAAVLNLTWVYCKCLCWDGWISGEGMGEKSKVEPFRETCHTALFSTCCWMGGESDNFQVTLSPCTVTRFPTELGRGSMGKADYQAKNKDLSLCMQDSYQALTSPPFYLPSLFLQSSSTNKLCKGSAMTSPPSPVWSARPCKVVRAQPKAGSLRLHSLAPTVLLSQTSLAGGSRGCSPQIEGSAALSFVSPRAKSWWPAVRQIDSRQENAKLSSPHLAMCN